MLFNRKTFDVIVIGLGAMGSATLYQLAEKGKRVLGIDQYEPPHQFGSTHGESRIIRQAYYEGKEYIPILKSAYELWRKVERDSGDQFFEITGALMMGDRKNSIVERSEISAKAYDLPYEILDYKEIITKFPQFKPKPNTWALLDKLAGYVKPENAVKNQLTIAKKLGAQLGLNELVEFWDAENYQQGIRVKTNRGDYFTEKLIVTTGSWAKGMIEELGITIKPERIVQFWMQPKQYGASFALGKFPIFLWNVEKNLDIYAFPMLGEKTKGCKVAFYPHANHPFREFCTANNIDREVHPKDTEQMKLYLEEYVPDLNGVCTATSICMHTESPDLHAIIDIHPDYPQVSFACGFSGHGFKFSNVVGKILSELALNETPSFDLSLFSANRFSKRLWESQKT
ncbi:MAG: N-methyl-L-tryptophan oxidase [Bacteroidota bacterium]